MCRLAVGFLFGIGLVVGGSFVRAEEQTAANYAPASTAPVAVADTPAPATPEVRVPDLSGCWSGNWCSNTNGHNGPMRANFCRLTDGNYQVTFVGRFALLVPFRYTTTLTVTGQKDGVVYLAGSHNLGPIMGCFTYSAWANDCQFVSSYCSNKDQGTFTLTKQ